MANLQALPGETYQDYEKRLGALNEGTGTGFGTPDFSNTPISSASFSSAPDLSSQVSSPDYQTPIVPDPYALTEEQKSIQKLINDTIAQQNSLAGEGAFRASEEGAQGIPEATKTLNDLLAQQQQVLNEQSQIQLTAPGPGQGGAATTIIQRQQAERLRQNAVSALSINSLVAAAQGKLATAQNLVDRAVAAKYDPIKAQIDAATKNLNLVLQSPAYTQAEKKQAQAQLDLQNKKKEEANILAGYATNIYNTAVKAASLGADSSTLNQISKLASNPSAENSIKASQLAAPFYQTKSSTAKYVDTKGNELSPFDAGRSIIDANPNLSDNELFLAIREKVPDLSITDINKLVAARPVNNEPITVDSVKKTVVDTLQNVKDIYSRSEAKALAEQQLKAALGLKTADKLPDAYKNAIEDALVEVYGATFFQNLIPGGRGNFFDLFK